MKKILFILLFCSISTVGVYAQRENNVKTEEVLTRQPDGGLPDDTIPGGDPIDPGDIQPICPTGQTVWYQDSDGDTYGNVAVYLCASTQPTGYVSNNSDCNDANPNEYELVQYFHDQDSDGIGGLRFKKLCSPPGPSPLGYNFVTINGDCNDNDSFIGLATITYYQDQDNDGYGDPNAPQLLCSPQSGYVLNNTDNCPEYYGTQPDGCPIGGIPENMNWIISRTYDIQGGITSLNKGYFNELGKSIQSQSMDIKTGSTWATQTLYDTKGRPALQSLSAPVQIPTGNFLFNPDFIKKGDGTTYASTDFETDENDPAPVGNYLGSLGWYYNESNTNEEYQDVTDYPFSRAIYSKLNPGSILKTVGGNKVSIPGLASDWLNGFTYTVPAAQELYYAFGKGYFGTEDAIEDSEEVITKFYKTVSIDTHGIESVVFTDGEGKTLAAARVGGDTKYDVVSTIGKQGYVDVHIPTGITTNEIQFLGNINNYKVYDLKTEEPIYPSFVTGGHFYRIEYVGDIENSQTFIGADGTITTPENAKGIRYKVNYYDYALNYYDNAGRLIETTQPLGFDANSLDLTAEVPHHQMKSTYKYNAQNQLLETTSPDEGTANFIYREDGQIRLSQNTKQAEVGEFSYTDYDDLARPIESGVYYGPLSFSESSYKQITLIDVADIEQEGNLIKKVPNNAWDSGIASVKMISGNGYIQFRFPTTNESAMVGLSSNNVNHSYNTIQFGLKVSNGQVYVFESNTQKAILGSYDPNDLFKIERIGSTIYYKKNNIAYSYTSSSSTDLLADIALNNKNSKIIDFEMDGNLITPNTNPYKYTTNVTTTGNTITKTEGLDTKWDAGFHSSKIITENGAVSWTVNQNNKLIMVGLSSQTALTTPTYSFIDYAIYTHSNGNYYVYERGTNKGYFGAYNANDTFKVERVGSQIKYFKNGVAFYTSDKPSFNEDLMAYGSFRNLNGAVSNITITGGELTFKDFYRIKTSGSEISKTATYSWNAAFASNETINGDGYVTFTAVDNINSAMIGLSEINTNNSYDSIDFAIYLVYTGSVYVYESGSNKGQKSTYTAGDTFKVERTGAGAIRYYKNDEVIYTSTEIATTPLLIDASFYTPEATIKNLEFYDLVNPSSIVTPTSNFDEQYCKERHITVYDTPDLAGLYAALEEEGIDVSYYRRQNFVAGNVAKTFTINPNTTTSWYSYDVFGRVEWLVQKIDGLGAKTIDYEYDPVKGNVTKILYQKHKPEELFVHKYEYNTIGQLDVVSTSRNNNVFTEQAKYEYYETGALKRTYLTQANQGIDYVYNLAGQLKAINHPSLTSNNDPGGDANDAFGMHIDYYNGDYARTGMPTPIETAPSGINRYDGNIKAVRWGTRGLDPNSAVQHNAYTYTYDKNKWLKEANYGVASNGIITPNANNDYRVSNLTYDANGNLLSLNRNKKTTTSTSNEMDNFSYQYNGLTNQLNHVNDVVASSNESDDLNSQNPNNYEYNSIGQLIKENQDGTIIEYIYSASGLVTQVKKEGDPYLNFYYNDKGQRVRKEVTHDNGGTWHETYYIRDVSGSVMSIYTGSYGAQTIALRATEYPIYGTSRLGVYNKAANSANYQLTDHLGNVRAVVSSNDGNMGSYTDYYPFGMPIPERKMVNGVPYRYAFQGQELDPETGKEAFQLRLWDSRIGRWLTTDPKGEFFSPYLGMGNNPINKIDPDGGMTSGGGCPDPPCDEAGNVVLNEIVLTGYTKRVKDLMDKGYSYSDIKFRDRMEKYNRYYFNIIRDLELRGIYRHYNLTDFSGFKRNYDAGWKNWDPNGIGNAWMNITAGSIGSAFMLPVASTGALTSLGSSLYTVGVTNITFTGFGRKALWNATENFASQMAGNGLNIDQVNWFDLGLSSITKGHTTTVLTNTFNLSIDKGPSINSLNQIGIGIVTNQAVDKVHGKFGELLKGQNLSNAGKAYEEIFKFGSKYGISTGIQKVTE